MKDYKLKVINFENNDIMTASHVVMDGFSTMSYKNVIVVSAADNTITVGDPTNGKGVSTPNFSIYDINGGDPVKAVTEGAVYNSITPDDTKDSYYHLYFKYDPTQPNRIIDARIQRCNDPSHYGN